MPKGLFGQLVRQGGFGLQAASLVAVLLSTLTSMAGNAHISKRIIAGLAGHAHGRAALRQGATKWQVQATGSAAQDPASKGALQWAVSNLWQLGARPSACNLPCMLFGVSGAPDSVDVSLVPGAKHAFCVSCVAHRHEIYVSRAEPCWLCRSQATTGCKCFAELRRSGGEQRGRDAQDLHGGGRPAGGGGRVRR